MADEKQDTKRKGISGLVFAGCLMLGFAVGFITDVTYIPEPFTSG